jgi:DNA processing protein
MRGICHLCARRKWLLDELNLRLERKAHDPPRLWRILELPDLELIDAVGGRRRAELHATHAEWEPAPGDDSQARGLCRHHCAYPSRFREDALGPHSLQVRGELERLSEMLEGKVVAIVGTPRASDYGMETARALARGLAASGATVASELSEGISSAVHTGALEASGTTLAVMTSNLERCSPVCCAPLYRRVLEHGCSIGEAHASPRVRRWWQYASSRTLALLVDMVIVVEATEQPAELACATVAWSRARHVAAVPGRVSSPSSQGTNSLLMDGARLVRDAQDALDVLYGVGVLDVPSARSLASSIELQPQVARVLERVSSGEDTVAKLTANGAPPEEISVALAELELSGLLLRGDAGRYVPCAGGNARLADNRPQDKEMSRTSAVGTRAWVSDGTLKVRSTRDAGTHGPPHSTTRQHT